MSGYTAVARGMVICLLAIVPAIAGGDQSDAGVALARVNGRVLSTTDLAPFLNTRHRGITNHGTRQLEYRRALAELIDAVLVSQQAGKMQIPDLELQVEARLAGLRQTHPARFAGKSETEMREHLQEELRVEAYLREKGVLDPEIPETEIRAFYAKGQESFRRDEAVHLQHITIGLAANAPDQERAAAREALLQARRQLVAGGDFASVAADVLSDHDGSSGDLGFLPCRELPEEIATAACSLAAGSISEVIVAPSAIHLIGVLERQPAGVVPFEEVAGFLRQYLREQHGRQVYQTLIRELRRQADIEILPAPD